MRRAVVVIPIAIFLLVAAPPRDASAETRVFHKGYHTYRGVTLPFHVYIPEGIVDGAAYPAVICLHGLTERGDDSSAVANNFLTTAWVSDATQASWPSFVLVPQCPVTALWTGDALLAANDIIDSLAGIYPIDMSRLYLTGLSMGGYGTWELIERFPQRFAAAVPLAGGGDPSKAEIIRDVPLWVFQGAIDFVVNPIISRGMVAAIESTGVTFLYTNCRLADCTGMTDADVNAYVLSGATHLYTEYQLGGHDIWPTAYSTPSLMTWVFSKSTAAVSGIAPTPNLPAGTGVDQNYPNPFNPTTTIRFTVGPDRAGGVEAHHGSPLLALTPPNSRRVRLAVFDLLGREVALLANGVMPAGEHSVRFDAKGLSSGAYICRLESGGVVRSIRMLLVR
jgi:hypothetical protein